MGVPKFYRWISERYPCLSETVREYQIPEFDNLYLDMNGIIHNCSHPNDDDVHFRISEEKMMADIFHYLEVLFRLIRPQKVFFMAIDGVAPRAKMNQQRGRRFRSAKEAEDKEKEALRKGEVLPEEQRFDSNCITPGTEFMVKLQKQLEYFVCKKVSEDPLWQKTQVILSGHQVPGEGEHKIMEFIRFQRSQPNYNVDTRHCLYGLDADLMMLGLCSHEPNFSLLREEVRFGGKKNEKRTSTPEETTFHLLHLSLLREYLDVEFSSLKSKLKFPYNLENIIDDWVLMGFLVGNDFIPHLPHFHINKGALPLLYAAYMDILPTMDGYLNENGLLNLPRFEKFMERLSQIDYDHFNDVYADTKWLESRHGRKRLVEHEFDDAGPGAQQPPRRNTDTTNFLLAKSAEIDDLLGAGEEEVDDDISPTDEEEDDDTYDESDVDEDKQFQAEFKAHKRHYYMDKLDYSEVDGTVLRDQAEGYVRAIQWILHYYYSGVCSWSWFYPHHYAPYVSDIRDFANLDLKFELGKPFLPYEQLLGVLPAASKALLPSAHHSLMSSGNSPIIEFYPTNFQTDKNGKQQEWEAVVLIPFIDEIRLIAAMKDCEDRLTPQERSRNSHGPMQVYVYTDTDLGILEAPAYFQSIVHNHCQCQELTRDAFVVPPEKLIKSLHPKFNPDKYIPGFPSMRHLSYKGTLKKSSVTVFNMATLNESQILTLIGETDPDVDVIGPSYCGQTVFVSWPHLIEARVVAVASIDTKYSFDVDSYMEGGGIIYKTDGSFRKTHMTPRDVDEWRMNEKDIKGRYASRWGVDIGQTKILIYATPITGRKYVYTQSGRVTLEKQWSTIPVPYAFQATVKDIQVHESVGHQYSTLSEVFPAGSTCFMLGHPGYGLQGRVLVADKNNKGKIRIEFDNIQEEESESQKQRLLSATGHYMPGYSGAQRLGISPHLISRITGTIYMTLSPTAEESNSDRPRRPRKINVGLSLKFNKSNEEVPGWSKKGETGWLYSMKTVEVLRRYIQEFPEFFDYVSSQNSGSDDFFDYQVFGPGPEGVDRARELQTFVETLPCAKAERQSCGMSAVDAETLPILLKNGPPSSMKLKPMVMQVRPHLLYKPDLSTGSSPPDSSTYFQLLDRVVNVRQGYCVPLGLRGTVIAIKKAHKVMDIQYEVLFDSEFTGGLGIRGMKDSPPRVYNLPAWAMMNLSHGKRQQMERDRQGKPTAVVRPSGSGVKQPPNNSVASASLRQSQHASYKAAMEHQPQQRQQAAKAPPPQQTKILARPEKQGAPASKQPAPMSGAGPVKKAPSPSSLPQPSPFQDIWDSLIQQHEQHQQQANGKAPPKVQQPQSKPKPVTKEPQPPVPHAPKLPSLQEAARNLPKVTKPGSAPRPPVTTPKSEPVAAATAAIVVPAPLPMVFPPPPTVQGPPGPGGPSISVQQLFDMAASAAPVVPILPAAPPPPPPPAFSFCIQLMDIIQKRGFGIPMYSYLPMADGNILAEVSLINLGVIGRAAAKTKIEAAEIAASVALRNPITAFAPMMIPNFRPPGPGPMFVGPPHPNLFAGPALVMQPTPQQQPPPPMHSRAPAPVPNSFVPMQVTRQSAQHPARPQQHQQQRVKHHQQPEQPADLKVVDTASVITTVEVVEQPKPQQPAKNITPSKPPGSRLAIRFNAP